LEVFVLSVLYLFLITKQKGCHGHKLLREK